MYECGPESRDSLVVSPFIATGAGGDGAYRLAAGRPFAGGSSTGWPGRLVAVGVWPVVVCGPGRAGLGLWSTERHLSRQNPRFPGGDSRLELADCLLFRSRLSAGV